MCKVLPVISSVVLAISLSGAAAAQGKATGTDTSGADDQLHELGLGLKAAIASGVMSDEEAMAIWSAAVASQQQDKGAAAANKADQAKGSANGLRSLWPPQPGRVRDIVRADFLTRDAAVFVEALELEEEQAAIVAMVLADYDETWRAAVEGLQQVLLAYHRSRAAHTMDQALTHLQTPVNPDAINVDDAMGWVRRHEKAASGKAASGKAGQSEADGGTNGEARADKVAQVRADMQEAVAQLQANLADIRARTAAQLAARADEDTVDARAVLAQIDATLDVRQAVRVSVVEMLESIIAVDDSAANIVLSAVLDQIAIDRGHQLARFHGERIVPEQMAFDVYGGDVPPAVQQVIDSSRPIRAMLVESRRLGALASERAAWAFKVRVDALEAAGEKIDPEEAADLMAAWDMVWRDQMATSTSIRDRALEQTFAVMAAADDDQADALWHSAMRQGFGRIMRTRPVQRLLHAAETIDTLDEAQSAALTALQVQVEAELRHLRQLHIEHQMTTDDMLARIAPSEQVRGIAKDALGLGELSDAVRRLRDRETELYTATHARLEVILTPEQFAALPAAPDVKTAVQSNSSRVDKALPKGGGKGKADNGI
ncbi:MAG: hypothetical protein MK101_11745 [Phycisphaerales bacterium]|nr:hypothetical protein [Phycisphaerales bacterium]